jgi:hypothetical protein
MKIVFASLPAYGHLYPMLPLAQACVAAGHDVMVAAGEPFLDALPVPTVRGIATGVTLQDIEQETARNHPTLEGVEFAVYMFGETTARLVEPELRGLFERERPDLVVYEPTDVGAKPFSLLKRALEETERVAVARVTLRTRERLATIRSYDGTMTLETMFWPDEIRSTGALDLPEGGEANVRAKELDMARSLVESLADKFEPESYTDEYRHALEELIERKMRGETRNAKRRKAEPKVVDLMDALRASVERAQGGRKADRSEKKPARRKAPKRSAA